MLFILITVIVTECRNIGEYSRTCRMSTGTFSEEELFIGKSRFDQYAIIFILYIVEHAVLIYKSRQYIEHDRSVINLLGKRNQLNADIFLPSVTDVRIVELVNP